MLTGKKALKNFILWVAAGLLLVAGITVLFDPFYQYHGPLPGMKEVLFERESQVIGSIRHFSYDSVLLGSSVVENCDSSYLDNAYGIKTLKVVKGSGSTADLMYYLEKAHEKQDIKRVFYGLDLFALKMPYEVTVVSQYSPNYLYTETILDDGAYLFNKDVLLKKIPLMLAYSFADKNTGGHAYDWSEDKTFGPAKAMEAYEGPYVQSEEKDFTDDKATIAANIALITEELSLTRIPFIRFSSRRTRCSCGTIPADRANFPSTAICWMRLCGHFFPMTMWRFIISRRTRTLCAI